MNQHLSAQKYFSKLKNENHNERQNKALFSSHNWWYIPGCHKKSCNLYFFDFNKILNNSNSIN